MNNDYYIAEARDEVVTLALPKVQSLVKLEKIVQNNPEYYYAEAGGPDDTEISAELSVLLNSPGALMTIAIGAALILAGPMLLSFVKRRKRR